MQIWYKCMQTKSNDFFLASRIFIKCFLMAARGLSPTLSPSFSPTLSLWPSPNPSCNVYRNENECWQAANQEASVIYRSLCMSLHAATFDKQAKKKKAGRQKKYSHSSEAAGWSKAQLPIGIGIGIAAYLAWLVRCAFWALAKSVNKPFWQIGWLPSARDCEQCVESVTIANWSKE